MKILVTGGTGFIGSHFLRHALDRGHEVLAIRQTPQSRPRINLRRQPEWISDSFADVPITKLTGIDCLVHLAASGVNEPQPWQTLLEFNVLQPIILWEKAIKAGLKHLVVCGSCFEYGKSAERYEFIPPDAPLEPVTPYAVSKVAATFAAISMFHTHDIMCSILRPFHVYGEGEASCRLWPSLRAAALRNDDFPMTLGGQIRDFTPVETVAEALLSCATIQPRRQLAIKNVGSGRPQSVADFCRHWWQLWGAKSKLVLGAYEYRPNEVMRYVPMLESLNPTAIKQEC